MLARRSVSDPDEIAYYRVFAPEGTAVEELARVAGTRWTIGSGFERAKGEMGLDEYEVRRLLLARWGPSTEWEERLRWSRWRRRHQERARRGHYARWLRHHPLA